MKKVLFHDSYLLSGIMCFDGCGKSIQSSLHDCIKACIKEKLLPADAQLTVDAEPQGLGMHNYIITIQSKTLDFKLSPDFTQQLSNKIKEHIYFELVTEEQAPPSTTTHWHNLLINLLAIGIISCLATFMSPSLFLTLGLTSFSFITTAFTARRYLLDFFRRLFNNESLFNMNTTVSLGWFLSLAHSVFHAVTMPVFSSASMVFMNWIMPVVLIACINGMDEIKRLLVEKAQKHHLKNLHTLFPQMASHYQCYELSAEHQRMLAHQVTCCLIDQAPIKDKAQHAQAVYAKRFTAISQLLPQQAVVKENKNTLKAGMLIQIEPNQCFPVDGIIIEGNTLVDSSLINGEPLQNKRLGQPVPAGAVNLGKKVTLYALKSSYNSTVNTLLLRANRAKTIQTTTEKRTVFWSLYTGLILLSLISALATPALLGIATLPLLLQNVIGILFAICPCTIALAHQLPFLLNHYHLDSKGIHLRDENLQQKEYPIHTYVFDKTGTLTTNTSVVASSTIPKTSNLWQRIYLLEKAYGKEHPIAKALMNYCKPKKNTNILFEAVQQPEPDPQNRGLSAWVLGKKLHIGNASYLKDAGITIPETTQIDGLTCVHVAENGQYQGLIYVQHQLRQGIREALQQLKKENKKLIMLTGDHFNAALALNKELGFVFDEQDIHAEQKPQDKEAVLEHLMNSHPNPEGFCFVGDGLNDAPCCRIVSEKGGLSCSMEADDKSTFFTDISLNGSLQYLFHHNALNQKLEQSLFQNQGIMIYSILSSLLFTLSFSITGLAIPPLIPMTIMLATTLTVLFNAYRTPLSIDHLLDKKSTWPIRFFASNHSIHFVLAATLLLTASLITATFISGTLTLPVGAFHLGPLMAISSLCTLSAIGLLGVVGTALTLHAWNRINNNSSEAIPPMTKEKPSLSKPNPAPSCQSYAPLFTPYKKILPPPAEEPLLPLPACSPLDN